MNILRFIVYVCILSTSFLSYSQSAFYNLGKSYAEDGNYDEAIRLTHQSIDLDFNNTDKYNLLLDYNALCEYFSYKNQPDSCQLYAQEVIDLWEVVEGVEYSDILRNLSNHFHRVGLIHQAIEYRNELVEIVKERYGVTSPRLVSEYRILSSFSRELEDKTNAIEYAKKEENLAYSTRFSEDNYEGKIPFEESFSWLRFILQEYEDPIAGIHYLLKCLNDHRDAIDKENRDHTLNTIWAMSRDNNFLDGCLAVYKEQALYGNLYEKFTNLINIFVEDKNIQNDVNAAIYVQSLYNLALKDELSIYFNSDDIEHLLSFLPDYYSTIGLTRQSFEMARKNYEYRTANGIEIIFEDVKVLIAASALKEESIYAIQLGENIIKSNRYANDDGVIRIIYEKLAGIYLSLGDQTNADIYLNKIGNSSDFQTLYSKAGIYLYNGNMKSLLPVALELNQCKDMPEKNRELVLWMLMCAARDSRNQDILLSHAEEYVNTYRTHLLNNLPLMSEEEQTQFIKSSVFSRSISFDFFVGIDSCKIDWSAAKEAYDYVLLSKGIILTSQNEFRNAIKNSPDSIIQAKWSILQQSNGAFTLQDEIIKRELIKYASQSNSYLKKLSYKWQDVRNALKKDEIAIEIIKCYNFRNLTDSYPLPYYVALILRSDYDIPQTVILSSTDFTGDLTNEELLDVDDSKIFENLWIPLAPYIEDANTIYFSPVEELNSIAIEYASMGDGKRVCDKWNLIRLSSTREIIDCRDIPDRQNAVLFGGLQYDVDRDNLIAESRAGSYHPTSSHRVVTLDNIRYGVEDLPGTLEEVNEIYNLFSSKPNLITGISGTEESFKSLGGSNFDIIHLATHGFFWTQQKAEKRKYATFIKNAHLQDVTFEDNAMIRSGLIFSGANIGLMGKDLPDDVEDGVLTAHELSSMNLGNVDMVVMSACESGLGAISGEGVFGLQRGFKLAGAKSLLMSLWKVDDKATKKLMIEFYRHYLLGMTKRESLYLAQQSLRNSVDYSDPKYWAAFILLDGLN